MDVPAQPNFQELTRCLTGAVNQISLIPNIPAVDNGQIIIVQLRRISEQLDTLQTSNNALQASHNALQASVNTLQTDIANINTRLNASETNSLGRLYNSSITNVDTPFIPVHDRQDRAVDGFPENGRALARLTNDDLTVLLRRYDQSAEGNIPTKRRRFRRFIGVMIEV